GSRGRRAALAARKGAAGRARGPVVWSCETPSSVIWQPSGYAQPGGSVNGNRRGLATGATAPRPRLYRGPRAGHNPARPMNDPTPDRGRARFPWLGVALFVLALAAAALGGFAWHYSDLILDPRSSSTLHEQRVLAAGPDWVRLSRDHESLEPGTWAPQW